LAIFRWTGNAAPYYTDLRIGNGSPIYEIYPRAPPFLTVATESKENLLGRARLI